VLHENGKTDIVNTDDQSTASEKHAKIKSTETYVNTWKQKILLMNYISQTEKLHEIMKHQLNALHVTRLMSIPKPYFLFRVKYL